MCLVLFAFQQHARFPLVVAANRDEFYQRPTATGHFWDDNTAIFGGRDKQAGGTWLAVTRDGKFSAVTNYREASSAVPAENLLSRGELVANYLSGDLPPKAYLEAIEQRAKRYAGFNLLVGSRHEMWCYSNRQQGITEILPGIHGLSNGALNEPWPKVISGRRELAEELQRQCSLEKLQTILLDKTRGSLESLPDTGVGVEAEEMLSSRFIQSEQYGTCTTTVLRIDNENNIDWLEQYFDSDGSVSDKKIIRPSD